MNIEFYLTKFSFRSNNFQNWLYFLTMYIYYIRKKFKICSKQREKFKNFEQFQFFFKYFSINNYFEILIVKNEFFVNIVFTILWIRHSRIIQSCSSKIEQHLWKCLWLQCHQFSNIFYYLRKHLKSFCAIMISFFNFSFQKIQFQILKFKKIISSNFSFNFFYSNVSFFLWMLFL